MPISTVIPVAYDWPMLAMSLPPLLEVADEVILGLDKDRISWSGHRFEFDDAGFRDLIKSVDTDGKVRVIEEDFHSSGGPMPNDTAEHNALGMACREGNWILHIDSDEVLRNGPAFVAALANVPAGHDARIRHYEIFKVIGDTAFVIDQGDTGGGFGPCATRKRGAHTLSRHTDRREANVNAGSILHYGWGRTRESLLLKLKHWSHSDWVDWSPLLVLWDELTAENFDEVQYKNFWLLYRQNWPGLIAVPIRESILQAA